MTQNDSFADFANHDTAGMNGNYQTVADASALDRLLRASLILMCCTSFLRLLHNLLPLRTKSSEVPLVIGEACTDVLQSISIIIFNPREDICAVIKFPRDACNEVNKIEML